jgi:hypothetical protein
MPNTEGQPESSTQYVKWFYMLYNKEIENLQQLAEQFEITYDTHLAFYI